MSYSIEVNQYFIKWYYWLVISGMKSKDLDWHHLSSSNPNNTFYLTKLLWEKNTLMLMKVLLLEAFTSVLLTFLSVWDSPEKLIAHMASKTWPPEMPVPLGRETKDPQSLVQANLTSFKSTLTSYAWWVWVVTDFKTRLLEKAPNKNRHCLLQVGLQMPI